MMASPPLTHPIVSAGSPDIRKRWECRCFAPWADDSSEENDDDTRASRHLHPTRQGNSYRAWSPNRPVPTYRPTEGETRPCADRFPMALTTDAPAPTVI